VELREDGEVRMRLGCGANQEAIANVTRTRCYERRAVKPSECKASVSY
jgi:hypothetical protein